MWILYATLAAFFAGVTAIFAKTGIKNIDTKLAVAIRTAIILICSLLVVLIDKSFHSIVFLDTKTLVYLVLSGISTAFLWFCYFKALQLADVNKVAPIDKTSIIFTLILSTIFLNEKITILKVISIILMLLGTFLMTHSKIKKKKTKSNTWFIYAILTAILTSTTTILGKIGLNDINSNLGALIKTIIVFIILWITVFITKKHTEIKKINKRSWLFIILSGITTCLSWLCYFKALQKSEASLVFPIEKLSIVVAVLGSVIFLKEKLHPKEIIGLTIIVTSTLLLVF